MISIYNFWQMLLLYDIVLELPIDLIDNNMHLENS